MSNPISVLADPSFHATAPVHDWSCVLFDLDGTLTDSAPGIVSSLAGALAEIGHPVTDEQELVAHVGPPLFDTLHAFGVSEEEYPAALAAYRSRADLSDLNDNAVFPGMLGLLRDLKDAGVPLAIATSKPDVRAVRILEHFGLAQYFTIIAGATLDQSRSTKADVVAHALAELRALDVDVSSPVLVGDRGHDVLGAEANGVPTILVEWGYGSPVEAVGAMAVVHSVDQLHKLLLG